MNLTINSTELSVHACNFILKAWDREEPGARVWPKWMSKLPPKIAIKKEKNKQSVYSLAALLRYINHRIAVLM